MAGLAAAIAREDKDVMTEGGIAVGLHHVEWIMGVMTEK